MILFQNLLFFVCFIDLEVLSELGFFVLPYKANDHHSKNKACGQTKCKTCIIKWTKIQFFCFASHVVRVSEHNRREKIHHCADNCQNEEGVNLILVAFKSAFYFKAFVLEDGELLSLALLDLFYQFYVQLNEA